MMNKKFMNQPLSRPLTPREKGIRTKYGTLFIFAALCAITLGVLYSNQEIQFKSLIKENEFRIDSLNKAHLIKIDDFKKKYVFQKIDSLEKIRLSLINLEDSLRSELFICNVQLQRWELAFETFKEREPKPAQRFGLIYNHETE